MFVKGGDLDLDNVAHEQNKDAKHRLKTKYVRGVKVQDYDAEESWKAEN